MEIYYCFLALLLSSVTMEIYRNTNGCACAHGTWGSERLAARQKPVKHKNAIRGQIEPHRFTNIAASEGHYCCCKSF